MPFVTSGASPKVSPIVYCGKISQMQLANMTGISQSAIAKWELGKTEPTASAIITLAKFFNETADYLLGLED